MVLLVDSPDLKRVTLVTLEAIKLESYIIALFPPLDWHWTILPQNLKEGVLTKKHLVKVVALIIVTRPSMGNGVRLTSSFPSSDLGKITSFNLFLPSCLTLISSVFIGCSSYVLINTLYPILINALYPIIIYTIPYYPILIVVHTLWSFHWLTPLDRHKAGKEFVSCIDLTKIKISI